MSSSKHTIDPTRERTQKTRHLLLHRALTSIIGLAPSTRRQFHDTHDFPWVRELEAAWPNIRSELDMLLTDVDAIPAAEDVQHDQLRVETGRQWRQFFLYGFGRRADWNCERCPATAKAVEKIPGLVTALFSILLPGKEIHRHVGAWKGVLRYHLGLKVPQDPKLAALLVGSETRHWSEGTGFVFDDTYPHEAWNRSDEIRAILLIDFERPLPFPLAGLNRAVIDRFRNSEFVAEAAENLRRWEEKRLSLDRADAETL